MAVAAIRHKHRHFKTLIVLVLAMTGGAFLLFWVAQFSPVTPLRGETGAHGLWNQIAVRAQSERSPRGFFHYRIDLSGRLFESSAWKNRRFNRATPGVVHILLTCPEGDPRVSPAQARTLKHIVSRLRTEYRIAEDDIHVAPAGHQSDAPGRRLRRT